MDTTITNAFAKTQKCYPRYAYGYDGIMRLFGVTQTTARQYKDTILKDAIEIVDNRIVMDVERALELYGEAYYKGECRICPSDPIRERYWDDYVTNKLFEKKSRSKQYEKKTEITRGTPLTQMTAGQLIDFLKKAMPGTATDPTKAPESNRRYVYGLKDIMQLFNVSNMTAQRYKNGIIKDAVKQYGRKIVVDADLALELFAAAKEEKKA